MRLHALLAWYDEPIPSLVSALESLSIAGVDNVVAVDGAFALFPDAKAASEASQAGIIAVKCRELGMSCTLHVPSQPWEGNEPQKRSALFALAYATASPGDWFMVHDADMVVTKAPADLKQRLTETDLDVAEVEVLDVVAQEANRLDWPSRFSFRGLYRAQKITVGPAHCVYTGESGPLWNGTGIGGDLPSLDLTDCFEVEHRPNERPHYRDVAKMQYYALRDDSMVERGDCSSCGEQAVRMVAARWKASRRGPVSMWVEACEPCAQRLDKVGRIRLRQLGVDPDAVTIENRNGRIPAGMASR